MGETGLSPPPHRSDFASGRCVGTAQGWASSAPVLVGHRVQDRAQRHPPLLEVPGAVKVLEGVAMELEDCAFPTLCGVEIGDGANHIFDGANVAMLVGASPRTKGMERSDLLGANGAIFAAQGQALAANAASDLRVVVTGNPANTNAYIAYHNAPGVPAERFTALTRLDHNRALHQLAVKAKRPVGEVTNMTIWATIRRPSIRMCSMRGSTVRMPPAGSVTTPGSISSSSRPSPSGGLRSSRRVAHRRRRRRRMRRSSMCGTGSRGLRLVVGRRWVWSPTGPMMSLLGWCRLSR